MFPLRASSQTVDVTLAVSGFSISSHHCCRKWEGIVCILLIVSHMAINLYNYVCVCVCVCDITCHYIKKCVKLYWFIWQGLIWCVYVHIHMSTHTHNTPPKCIILLINYIKSSAWLFTEKGQMDQHVHPEHRLCWQVLQWPNHPWVRTWHLARHRRWGPRVSKDHRPNQENPQWKIDLYTVIAVLRNSSTSIRKFINY